MSEEPPVAGVNPGDDSGARGEAEPMPQKWPVGFILLIVAGTLYLAFRVIQMVGWLIDWAS